MKAKIDSLTNNKQWVCAGRAVDNVFLTDSDGAVLYESALPWLVGRLDDKSLVDVVAVVGLKRALVVLDLKEATFEPLRPVLLRELDEAAEELEPGSGDVTSLYLPLTRQQLSFAGSRHEGEDRFDEFLLEIPMLVEAARVHEPVRQRANRVRISNWVRHDHR